MSPAMSILGRGESAMQTAHGLALHAAQTALPSHTGSTVVSLCSRVDSMGDSLAAGGRVRLPAEIATTVEAARLFVCDERSSGHSSRWSRLTAIEQAASSWTQASRELAARAIVVAAPQWSMTEAEAPSGPRRVDAVLDAVMSDWDLDGIQGDIVEVAEQIVEEATSDLRSWATAGVQVVEELGLIDMAVDMASWSVAGLPAVGMPGYGKLKSWSMEKLEGQTDEVVVFALAEDLVLIEALAAAQECGSVAHYIDSLKIDVRHMAERRVRSTSTDRRSQGLAYFSGALGLLQNTDLGCTTARPRTPDICGISLQDAGLIAAAYGSRLDTFDGWKGAEGGRSAVRKSRWLVDWQSIPAGDELPPNSTIQVRIRKLGEAPTPGAATTSHIDTRPPDVVGLDGDRAVEAVIAKGFSPVLIDGSRSLGSEGPSADALKSFYVRRQLPVVNGEGIALLVLPKGVINLHPDHSTSA